MPRKFLSHYNWLHKNFERFCENAGFKYFPGAISADGDKLDRLKHKCEEQNLPFYKISAIGLVLHGNGYFKNLEKKAIKLYKEHPEWFENLGGEEDAIEIF